MQSMLQAIHHRGPNDKGSWSNDAMHLGMTRLSILDLSYAGHQPMISSDQRYVLVFNGEVYNFKEQREALAREGFTFRSNTDTEVVLNLFVKYGRDCLSYMRGMFAFAVWDNQEKELFIARDHMGIKPLLYYYHDGCLVFCSEIKGILASGLVPKKLSTQGLNLYLQKGFIAPPYTAIENVRSLNPGHCLTFKPGNEPAISQYWDIDIRPQPEISYEEAVKEVRNMVLASVQEELVSDVPLGVFLSGGLDSSIMVGAMRELGIKDISTFSVGFKSTNLDETPDAEESAKFYGTNHEKVIIGSQDVIASLDNFIYGLDQPSVDGLNTYLVSKASKQHVSVALSGLGGDELFAGYAWQHRYYKNTKLGMLIGEMLSPVNEQLNHTGKIGRKLKNRYTSYTNIENYYTNIHLLFNRKLIDNPLLFDVKPDTACLGETIHQYAVNNNYTRLQQVNKMDLRYFMGAQLLRDSDAVSMVHSLEVRFPLIDKRLVDFVFNLPDHYKIHHNLSISEINKGYEQQLSYKAGGVKKLLFDAFEENLPDNFNTRSKRGFKMPYAKWMREEPLITKIIESLLALEGKITARGSTAHLLNAWNVNSIGWQQIWALFILQQWMEQHKIDV